MIDVCDCIIQIIVEQVMQDLVELKFEMIIEQIGIDSFGFVELIFVIEEEFDILVFFNVNELEKLDFDIFLLGVIIVVVEKLVVEKV